jgi:hypothetical protein
VNWLLLPTDELELATHLTRALGLRLVSPTPTGWAVKASDDPPDELPPELPIFGALAVPMDFVFWIPSAGPIRFLRDRATDEGDDARSRVALRLTQDADAGWRDLIDLQRTPVIRYRRCLWRDEKTLIPGVLQGMDLKVREHPPSVLRTLRMVDKWLKRDGERLNPFEHCRNLPATQPRNLAVFWVWARPAALAWVRNGGEIWPWTGG